MSTGRPSLTVYLWPKFWCPNQKSEWQNSLRPRRFAIWQVAAGKVPAMSPDRFFVNGLIFLDGQDRIFLFAISNHVCLIIIRPFDL